MTTYELIALDDNGHEQARYPVATLPFKPGDVLVVQICDRPPMAEMDRFRKALEAAFPGRQLLIVYDNVRFLRLEAIE